MQIILRWNRIYHCVCEPIYNQCWWSVRFRVSLKVPSAFTRAVKLSIKNSFCIQPQSSRMTDALHHIRSDVSLMFSCYKYISLFLSQFNIRWLLSFYKALAVYFLLTECLRETLTAYVKYLGSRVRLIRLSQRSGLIRARLAGAEQAQGSTLTFLDAHCEVTEGWLEPLIAHVALNPHSVVCPAIDVISDTTFEYLQSESLTLFSA